MRIVLTGHKGFIGQHFYNHIKNDNEVHTYDLLDGQDLKNKSLVDDMPDCDVVVHMAATNGTRLFYETPTEVTMNNTLPTMHIVERYKDTPTKIVFTSTCEIFNGAVDKGLYPVPTDENVPVMFDDITNARWSYSIPKALGENLISNLRTHWLIIRYFNVYGPGEENKGNMASVAFQAHRLGKFKLFPGNPKRDFVYVKDVVSATIHPIFNDILPGVYEVGSGVARTFEDVLDLMGVKYKYRDDSEVPNGYQYYTKANKKSFMTGWKPIYSLEKGLTEYKEYLES